MQMLALCLARAGASPSSLHLGTSLRPEVAGAPKAVLVSALLCMPASGTVHTCLRQPCCRKGPLGEKHAWSLPRLCCL